MSRPILALLLLAVSIGASGCVSTPPTPPYRRVDKDAPAYRAAVAQETAAQLAQGKSAAEAAERAERRVTAQFVAVEKQRRLELVAPLTAALAALERPRGCWAYTVTTRTTRDGTTTLRIERFDPYQPEEKLWTLVAVDGHAPTEATQADYRRAKLRAWKKQETRAMKRTQPANERTRADALYAELETAPSADPNVVAYRFVRDAAHVALVADIPPRRDTYLVNTASNAVVRHEATYLAPGKALGGTIIIEVFEAATDYVVIDPAAPPFPAKTTGRTRYRLAMGTTHEEITERTFSDYRRVKCYDDRFQAIPGELRPIDIIPNE